MNNSNNSRNNQNSIILANPTEILDEIEATNKIVVVTDESSYQEAAKSNPRVINSPFDASTMSNKEIDNTIVELFKNGKNI